MISVAVIDLGLSGLLLPQLVHRRVRQVTLAIQFAFIGQHETVAVRSRDLLKLGRTGQATGMAGHMPDRDRANRGFQQDMRLVFLFDDHPFLELWYEPGYG